MDLGQHTWLDDVGHGMQSSTLGSKRGWKTSGMTCNLRPWSAHAVARRRVLHVIIALGQHKWLNFFGHGMQSFPFDKIHRDRRIRAWHAIISLGKHTQPDNVGCGILSLTFECTHDRTMLGVAMLSSPKGSTYGRGYLGRLMQSFPFGQHIQLDDIDVA